MVFDHYKERSALLAAEVVNTQGWPSGRDSLEGTEDLEAFLRRATGWSEGSLKPGDLAEFRRWRERLRAIFFAEDDGRAAEMLNDALRDSGAVPQLVRTSGAWQMEFTQVAGDTIRRLAAATSLGLAALFEESGRSRFGVCSADNCLDVFIDTSKNRSRRYCAESCSSRTNVAAHRARKRTT